MISRKPYVLKEAVKRFGEDRYLMLDADMTVRKSLEELFSKLNSHDGAFCFRNGIWDGKVYDHLKVASGVILIKPSCISVLDKWRELMERKKEISGVKQWEWFWDQITLLKALEEVTNLNYSTIEETYFQNDFDDNDAFIWSANVNRKDKKEAYRIMKRDLFRNKKRGQVD